MSTDVLSEQKITPQEPTPGPWEYIASTEHHGPYVVAEWGGTVCDFYVMSNPSALSVLNGGDSKPVHFMHEQADANARLAAAAPEMLEALKECHRALSHYEWYAEDDWKVRERTEAALAKAEGRQS